jgi:hypothetical protein
VKGKAPEFEALVLDYLVGLPSQERVPQCFVLAKVLSPSSAMARLAADVCKSVGPSELFESALGYLSIAFSLMGKDKVFEWETIVFKTLTNDGVTNLGMAAWLKFVVAILKSPMPQVQFSDDLTSIFAYGWMKASQDEDIARMKRGFIAVASISIIDAANPIGEWAAFKKFILPWDESWQWSDHEFDINGFNFSEKWNQELIASLIAS